MVKLKKIIVKNKKLSFKNNKEIEKQLNIIPKLKLLAEKIGIDFNENKKKNFPDDFYITKNYNLPKLKSTNEPDSSSNIILVTCVYKRPILTKFVLEYLSKLNFSKIVVVYSLDIDYNNLKNIKNCDFYKFQNNPISLKWNHGINMAKKYNPDAVMITGSDDLINPEYLKIVKNLIYKEYDYIYNDNWIRMIVFNNEFFFMSEKYIQRKDGIGSGKVISRKILNKCNWNIYNFNSPKGLDWRSYKVFNKYIKKPIKNPLKYTTLLIKTVENRTSLSIEDLNEYIKKRIEKKKINGKIYYNSNILYILSNILNEDHHNINIILNSFFL